MEGIGDYIYLIILAIAGLSGLLKKKKPETTTDQAPAKPKRTWEDVLRELTPIDEEEEIKPEVPQQVKPHRPAQVQRHKQPEQPRHASYETVEDVSTMRAKKNVVPTATTNRPRAITTPEPEIRGEFQISTPEEARRAFIYSEIFNRKYS